MIGTLCIVEKNASDDTPYSSCLTWALPGLVGLSQVWYGSLQARLGPYEVCHGPSEVWYESPGPDMGSLRFGSVGTLQIACMWGRVGEFTDRLTSQ